MIAWEGSYAHGGPLRNRGLLDQIRVEKTYAAALEGLAVPVFTLSDVSLIYP
jgi:hypothetical protein